MGHPKLKVYDKDGKYRASVHHYVDAYMFARHCLPEGSTVRVGHSKMDIVYMSGTDDDASDDIVDLMLSRRDEIYEAREQRQRIKDRERRKPKTKEQIEADQRV